jgi:hypothetical protein
MADEWTTVTSKKAAAAAYVPPSMRAAKAAAEDAKKPLNLASEILFPSLGTAAPAPKGAWAAKVNFKQKVEELIEKDKQTAEEKALAEEERKAMEGWEVFEMPKLTTEWAEAWHKYIAYHNAEERRIAALIDMGLYLEPIVEPKKYVPSKTTLADIDSETESIEDEQERLSDLD